ncbi:MAG: SPOR domain-containing protein [Deltaproteobacteria bacterium]|nr:SPOR domain-containing protein [Deltaproteobacteria bacterium]
MSGKKIFLAVFAFAVLGFLLFATGWIVAVMTNPPESGAPQATVEAKKAEPEKKPPEAPSALVKKPMPEQPKTEAVPEKTAPETEAVSLTEVKPEKAASEAPTEKAEVPPQTAEAGGQKQEAQAPAAPEKGETVEAPKDKGAETAEAPKEKGAGEDAAKKEEQPKKTSGQAAAGEAEEDEGKAYSVQIGAFLVQENARKLAKEIKARGYDAAVLLLGGAADKTWYVVQIGDYPRFKQASEAARAFMEKEEIIAVVNPVPSALLEESKKEAEEAKAKAKEAAKAIPEEKPGAEGDSAGKGPEKKAPQ